MNCLSIYRSTGWEASGMIARIGEVRMRPVQSTLSTLVALPIDSNGKI